MYQFGCGILKMVGPRKRDLWTKINILKGNHCILRIRGVLVHKKWGMILENKVVQKFKLEKKNVFFKKWSPKLIFLYDFFLNFLHRKLTLKVRFRLFLTNHNSLQDCFKTISFFGQKSCILGPTIFKIPQPN